MLFHDMIAFVHYGQIFFQWYPCCGGIVRRDFLLDDLSTELPSRENVIIIGNPPFGSRARTAAQFINRGFESLLFAMLLLLRLTHCSEMTGMEEKRPEP